MNLENFDKLEIIVNVTKKCAELLKDPTLNGKRQLEATQRNEIREEYYTDLIRCIDILSIYGDLYSGFNDIIDIHNKLNSNNDITKQGNI